MKTLIKTILCVLIVYSTQVISSSLTFDFSNPAFSGEGYSSHVLSISQLEYNRKEAVKDDLLGNVGNWGLEWNTPEYALLQEALILLL